jgi:hypothetical protein
VWILSNEFILPRTILASAFGGTYQLPGSRMDLGRETILRGGEPGVVAGKVRGVTN